MTPSGVSGNEGVAPVEVSGGTGKGSPVEETGAPDAAVAAATGESASAVGVEVAGAELDGAAVSAGIDDCCAETAGAATGDCSSDAGVATGDSTGALAKPARDAGPRSAATPANPALIPARGSGISN